MKKTFTTIFLLIIVLYAMSQNKEIKKNLSFHIGYGTENNWGNTHFFAGAAYEKLFNKKIKAGISITGLTTSILNTYKGTEGRPSFEDRKYNALFITAPFSFVAFGKNNERIKWSFSAGPSLKIYYYKMLRSYNYTTTANGTRIWDMASIRYEEKKGVLPNLFVSTDITCRVNNKISTGIFLQTYSGLILLEHFMPGLKVDYKL